MSYWYAMWSKARSWRARPTCHMQVVEKEGIYADGMVTLQPLPEEMHGYETRDVLLRQLLEGQKLSQSAAAEHRDKELLKVGSTKGSKINGVYLLLSADFMLTSEMSLEYWSISMCTFTL